MLIGRASDCAALDELIREAQNGNGGCVVLRGEAGIGKTALLDEAAAAATTLLIARISGVESESEMGYGALHRLLARFLHRRSDLPSPQRDALGSAFGLLAADAPDRFLVGLAALTLLGDAAATQPLLCIVDDAQWLDRDSVSVMEFVARRLHADRIALIFAVREPADGDRLLDGLAEREITGLTEGPALELLASSVTDRLNSDVAGRIFRATRGNPLALVDLGAELTSEDLTGRSVLPDPLPIGHRLEARYQRQIRSLPASTQSLLLVAAAEPTGDPRTLWRAAAWLGLAANASDAAEASGLLRVAPRVQFRHPLIRSAVYSSAPPSARRQVHEALAAVTDTDADSDRRASHRALAALGPDEGVAVALEESAARARARGGYTAESSFLQRSAELTPDPERQARRLLEAARAALAAGNPVRSEALLADARPGLAGSDLDAQAQQLDGSMRTSFGQSALAAALLLGAARTFEGHHADRARIAVLEAIDGFMISGEFTSGTTASEIADAAMAVAADEPATIVDLLLAGFAALLGGPYRDAVPPLRAAAAALCEWDSTSGDVEKWFNLGPVIANELWDPVTMRTGLDRMERAARERGALLALQKVLLGQASQETKAGRFAAAESHYAEAMDVTATIGSYVPFYALVNIELIAWRGDRDKTESTARQLVEMGRAVSSAAVVHMSQLAVAILELGSGCYAEAQIAAQSVIDANTTGWACQAFPHVVESAVRNGDRESATRAMDTFTDRALTAGTPFALGLLARCHALLADDAHAESQYQEALVHLGETGHATEIARTHLVYGEWLRRQKRKTDARDELRTAYEMFATMGAHAFAERARTELLATGERARTRTADTANDLTPRESQIARLAAERATSREIAAQLFISANTVDYHLRKIFRKLNITSRRDLAVALAEASGSDFDSD